jgi:hypothetical protein
MMAVADFRLPSAESSAGVRIVVARSAIQTSVTADVIVVGGELAVRDVAPYVGSAPDYCVDPAAEALQVVPC